MWKASAKLKIHSVKVGLGSTREPTYSSCWLECIQSSSSLCALSIRAMSPRCFDIRVRCQLNGKPTKMYPTAADFERFKSHASAYTGLVAFVYVAFFTSLPYPIVRHLFWPILGFAIAVWIAACFLFLDPPLSSIERVYATSQDDSGKTTVQFGDGAPNEHPPRNDEHLRALFPKSRRKRG